MEHNFNWFLKYTIHVILTTGGLCHMDCLTTEAALEAKGLQGRLTALPSPHSDVPVRMLRTSSACSFAEECRTEGGECLSLSLQLGHMIRPFHGDKLIKVHLSSGTD